MFAKLKKLFNKGFIIFLFVVSITLIVVFRSWIGKELTHLNAFYYVNKGDGEYQNGHLQKAIDDYNYGLKLYPEHVKARYNLGNIYSAYEDYYSAVSCYEEALKYDPNHLNTRINLGILMSEQMHDYDRAISEFKSAINSDHLIIVIPFVYNNTFYLNSNYGVAYYNLGLAYRYKSLLYGMDRFAARRLLGQASQSYRKAIKFDPDVFEFHYNYALALHLLGNHQEALKEYCKAVNLEPLNYEAHYNLAILLRDRKRYKDALTELQKTALILDSRNQSDKIMYIFHILTDVGQRVVPKNSDQYRHEIERLNDAPKDISGNSPTTPEPNEYTDNDLTYVNGKVVASDELDAALINNFKMCKYCEADSY